MKLKFIFFPASLLFATVMAIWFIWPTWFDETDGIAKIKTTIEEEGKKLNEVKLKKSNLNGLIASMDENGGTNKNFTMKYYPNQDKNEIIVNEINQFAKDAGVSIKSVSVEEADAAKSKRELENCLAVGEVKKAAARTGAATNPSGIVESQVTPVAMNIEILGNYANIKSFLVKVYGMEMINNLPTIEVAKVAELVTGETGTTAVVTSGDLLNAEVGLCFGYLGETKVGLEGDILLHDVFKDSSYDFTYIAKLQEMIASPAREIQIGATSKANPFIP